VRENKTSGDFCTTINGQKTDAGLYDHVFDGTDDAHDERLKAEKILKLLKQEMQRRGMIEDTFEKTVLKMTEDF
jgi:hypothetical protein